jgi:hypothetical protein
VSDHGTLSASPLVFVPTIGFRAAGTRLLPEPVDTVEDGTRLTLLAVAAAPDRTDLRVEWKWLGDAANCSPRLHILAWTPSQSFDASVTAGLVVGSTRLDPTSPMTREGYSASRSEIRVAQTMTFPPLDANAAALVVGDGRSEWRVPFTLAPAPVIASELGIQAEREGIVVRATAVAFHGEDVVVALEAEGPQEIRRVGGAVGVSQPWRGREQESSERAATLRRFWSNRAESIGLESDNGIRVEEHTRLFAREPQRAAPGQGFVTRFAVMFETPGADAKRATLVVPFIEFIDRAPSVRADLRHLPVDLALGEHRFRVVSADEYGPDEKRIVLEIPPHSVPPRFVQPLGVQGVRPGYSFSGPAAEGEAFWMATAVGDPPIVTFSGSVTHVDGPWRLEFPLA